MSGNAFSVRADLPVPHMRSEGASRRFDQVAVQGTRAVDRYGPLGCRRALACARSAEKERCRGWGKLSTPLPTQAWPGRIKIAKPV